LSAWTIVSVLSAKNRITISSAKPCWPQKLSLRTNRANWPVCHSARVYGPVPTSGASNVSSAIFS
jgi:hypothetical protein